MVAIDRNSKLDTVFYSTDTAGLEVDIGQERTNLTNGVGTKLEAPSARVALVQRRELAIVVEVSTADSGTVLYHGNADGSADTFRISVVPGGFVRFIQNTVALSSKALPNVGAVAQKFLLHWSTRARGALETHEFACYNYGTPSWGVDQVDTALGTTSVAYDFHINDIPNGTDPYTGGLAAIESVRVGRRFHTTTEAQEDWVLESTPGPFTTDARAQRVPVDSTTTVADEGSFAGPAYSHSKASGDRHRRRLYSPLVNETYVNPAEKDNTYTPVSWHRQPFGDSPDVDKYHMPINFLRRCPLPVGASRFKARIHIQTYSGIGSPEDINLRVYSINRIPAINDAPNNAPQDPVIAKYAEEVINVDHPPPAGVGEWVEFDVTDLSVGQDEDGAPLTYMAIAYSVDLDAPGLSQDEMRFFIHAWTVEPARGEDQPNELDFNQILNP